jgi:hypothetical protein
MHESSNLFSSVALNAHRSIEIIFYIEVIDLKKSYFYGMDDVSARLQLEVTTILLKDCNLIVVRRFEYPDNTESYAGRSLSSWQDHPSQTGQRVGVRRNVVSLVLQDECCG